MHALSHRAQGVVQKNGPKNLKSPPPKKIWVLPTIGELTVVVVVVIVVVGERLVNSRLIRG